MLPFNFHMDKSAGECFEIKARPSSVRRENGCEQRKEDLWRYGPEKWVGQDRRGTIMGLVIMIVLDCRIRLDVLFVIEIFIEVIVD